MRPPPHAASEPPGQHHLATPPAAGKLWALQALRFFAALAVVHLHAVQQTKVMTGSMGLLGHAGWVFGRCGVDIFFVISGFIITTTSRGLGPGAFAAKRLRRIVPFYFLMTLPWVALGVSAGDHDWRRFVASFLFMPATDRITEPYLAVGWTLCFEMLFYACAAFVLWKPKSVWVVLVTYMTLLALPLTPALRFLGNPIILEFLAGVALAYAPRWRHARWGILAGTALLIAGAVLQWPPIGRGVDFIEGYQSWARLLTLGLPATLIVWGVLQLKGRPGVLAYLGDASYALYLAHPIALWTLFWALRETGLVLAPDLIIVTGVGVSLVVACVCRELMEKPILRALSGLGARRPNIGPGSAASANAL